MKHLCPGRIYYCVEFLQTGDEAVNTFLQVAAGLDSQIPGDYEVIAVEEFRNWSHSRQLYSIYQ
jgi:hypothetical protein